MVCLKVETEKSELVLSESEHGIFNAILRGHIDFTSDPWPSISNAAKDLVRKMLTTDPKQRLTAQEVLSKHSLFFAVFVSPSILCLTSRLNPLIIS